MAAGNGGRRRHMARDAETSVRGWQVAGVGEFQVENVPHPKRRWGSGVQIERCEEN